MYQMSNLVEADRAHEAEKSGKSATVRRNVLLGPAKVRLEGGVFLLNHDAIMMRR